MMYALGIQHGQECEVEDWRVSKWKEAFRLMEEAQQEMSEAYIKRLNTIGSVSTSSQP